MKMISMAMLIATLCSTAAQASDFEELCKDGYGVIETTAVNGDFEGCDFDRRIKLTNGLIFVCTEYSYSYGYSPDVYILKHVKNGDLKVIIDDEEYDGDIYRSR